MNTLISLEDDFDTMAATRKVVAAEKRRQTAMEKRRVEVEVENAPGLMRADVVDEVTSVLAGARSFDVSEEAGDNRERPVHERLQSQW